MRNTKDGLSEFYIYFFPERGKEQPAIKIGYSKHPIKRLKQLQTGHPTKIGCEGWYLCENEDQAFIIEHKLHKRFEKDRIRKNGEWFNYSNAIKEFIESLLKDKLFTRYYE